MSLVIERPGHTSNLSQNAAAHIEITCSDGYIGVSVTGELDAFNTAQLRECLRNAVDDGVRETVLDIAEVTYMDSRSLAVILAAHRRMAEVGATLVICGTTPLNAKLFYAAGAGSYLSNRQEDSVLGDVPRSVAQHD
jgi:anti-anti-sigma factor